ncbi:MAG: methyl-accepting chemotaxis protein, partial [Desulfobacteraceae bacterium]
MSVKMRLKSKLLLAFLSVGIIPFVILAVVATNKASRALSQQAFNQLVSIRDIKKGQVERYLQTIKDQAITFSEDGMIVSAMT